MPDAKETSPSASSSSPSSSVAPDATVKAETLATPEAKPSRPEDKPAKPDEKKKDDEETGWRRWVNHTTALLAVLAALSSGRWGASNLNAILDQGKVNDKWGEYQAQKLKLHVAESAADLEEALALDMAARSTAQDAAPYARSVSRQALRIAGACAQGPLLSFASGVETALTQELTLPVLLQHSRDFEDTVTERTAKVATISKALDKLQVQRDDEVESSLWFEISFAFLQIGVILSTIAGPAKKEWLWIGSIVCGVLGIAIVVNGYFLFLRLPRAATNYFVQSLDASKAQGK